MPCRQKTVVGAVLIALALGYLCTAALRSGWVYYLPVDQLAENPSLGQARVRVHGVVDVLLGDGGQDRRPVEFVLRGELHRLRVAYRGVLPDTFASGREAVAEGTLGSDGVLHADRVMTKCSSKYEARDPRSARADPSPRGGEGRDP